MTRDATRRTSVKRTPLDADVDNSSKNGAGASLAKPAGEKISSGDKHLHWIPVSQMRISPVAQRKHNSASSREKIEKIAMEFDPDKFGTPTVNLRDGIYWVIDGGHRYLALLLMGWDDQQLQCWLYEGLSEAQEADKFLALNDVKSVSGMDKFRQALVAGHAAETDIDRITRACNLSIGIGRDSIGCVHAIKKTYENGGGKVLAITLRVIRDAYGIPGFNSKVTEGIGLFVENYENRFNEQQLVSKLTQKRGGVSGLRGEAERIRNKYSISLAHAIAAATTETYNQGRRGTKLESWLTMLGIKSA